MTENFFGPSSTSVALDPGIRGERGNAVLTSRGNPNIPGLVTQALVPFDLCIDVNPESPTYSFLFRYQLQDDNLVWIPILRLNASSISVNKDVFFVDGTTSVNLQVPVPAGIEITGDIRDRLDLQYSIVGYTDDISYTPEEESAFEQFLAEENVQYDGGDDYFGEDPEFFDQTIDGGDPPTLLPSASIPDEALNSPISSFFEISEANIAGGIINLVVDFESILFFGGSWSPLQGEKILHLVITVV